MDFFTSTILGGIIYDLIKLGIKENFKIAEEVIQKLKLDNTNTQDFIIFLNNNNFNQNSSLEDIIKAIENDTTMQLYINNINTLNLNTTNATININDNKKKFPLNTINEKFRNYQIDFIFGIVLFFVNIFIIVKFHTAYHLPVTLIIILLYFFYLPKFTNIMFIFIKEDKLIYLNNKVVNYSDILEWYPQNNGFYWRLNSPKYISLTLYTPENAQFIANTIKRFAIHKDSLIPS